MNKNVVIGIVVLVAAGLWWSHSPAPAPKPEPAAPAAGLPRKPPGSSLVLPPPSAVEPAKSPMPSQIVSAQPPTAKAPNTPDVPPPPAEPPKPISDRKKFTEEMRPLLFMLRDYRTLMNGNPVGSNAEIMKSLMGGNPKRARLGPPPGFELNGDGELIDHWGTPFFFHQQSATEMEIHSAGPDKVMWTTDDIVIR